jgi:uncharacterized protein (TIGR02996 family)
MPTDEQRALWAAIREQPDDDTPRLVYADWLQEHGDEARAEFIRVQCELARQPYDRRRNRKQRANLEAKEAELLAAHKKRWTEPLRAAVEVDEVAGARLTWFARLQFARGFLQAVYLNFPAAVRLIDSGHEPEPIHYLEMSHDRHAGAYSRAAVAALASWQFGSCVSTFSLAGAVDEDVRAFLAGGRLTRLRRLDFWSGSVSDAAVAQLANSPLVASVLSLCLSANKIGDAGAFALADSPHLSDRCSLNLYSNPIGPAGRAHLRERFPRALQIESS